MIKQRSASNSYYQKKGLENVSAKSEKFARSKKEVIANMDEKVESLIQGLYSSLWHGFLLAKEPNSSPKYNYKIAIEPKNKETRSEEQNL